MSTTRKTVFVAMSGGVDSSVTALLLKKRGYRVVGVFMRSYNIDGCADRDAEDARRVAEHISIPFYVWNFEEEYKQRVIKYMVDGYRAGLTPNPDIMCNKEIKFGLFFDRAISMGADYIATGHYVRTGHRGKALFTAKDKNKDQSYFLWTLTPEQIKKCIFPIGDYLKPRVREIARRAKLPTAEKKDSQGICFLGEVNLTDFLKTYIPERRGEVITVSGKKIGTHRGVQFYTIGQRQGLGIGGGKPYYVVSKNAKKNMLTVAESAEDESLFRRVVNIKLMNFMCKLRLPMKVFARVRYRQPLAPAILNKKAGVYSLDFIKPVKFVAPGQSAVFYTKAGEVLGGGVIL